MSSVMSSFRRSSTDHFEPDETLDPQTVAGLIDVELRAVAERGLETAELARVHGQLTGKPF